MNYEATVYAKVVRKNAKKYDTTKETFEKSLDEAVQQRTAAIQKYNQAAAAP